MLLKNGAELTSEESRYVENLHILFENDMKRFCSWFDSSNENSRSELKEDVKEKISKYVRNIPVEAAVTTRYYGMNILHHLVMRNLLDDVEYLLKAGVNPDIKGGQGIREFADKYKSITPLHFACFLGNLEMVKLLIQYGADANLCDDKNRNCFHYLLPGGFHLHGYIKFDGPIFNQRLEIAKLLKADINQKNADHMTPMECLLKNFQESDEKNKMFQCFTELGADVNKKDENGNTLLSTASKHRQREFVRKLHTLFEENMQEACCWFDNSDGNFYYEMKEERKEKISEYVRNMPIDAVTSTRFYGMNILQHLVMRNLLDDVEYLLKAGVDPNITGSQGMREFSNTYKSITSMHIACMLGNLKMVKLLLKYGAYTSLCDDKNRNCFHYLLGYGYNLRGYVKFNKPIVDQRVEIAKLINADINQKSDDGIIPIFGSLYNERLLNCFVELGADLLARDEDGNTPFMIALKNNKTNICLTILKKCPECINCQNNAGNTAAHTIWTYRGGHMNIMIYLLHEMGADFTIPDDNGDTVEDFFLDECESNFWDSVYKEEKTIQDYLYILKEFIPSYKEVDWTSEDSLFKDIVENYIRDFFVNINPESEEDVRYINSLLGYNSTKHLDVIIDIIHKAGIDFCDNVYNVNGKLKNLRDILLEYGDRHKSILKFIELGIDVNEPLFENKTPAYIIVDELINADETEVEQAVNALKCLDPDSMTELSKNGKSALHIAAERSECTDIVKVMVAMGADINVTTEDSSIKNDFTRAGDTPLHLACSYHNADITSILMDAGADDTLINIDGDTPAHCIFKESRSFRSARYYSCQYSLAVGAIKILELLDNIDIPNTDTGYTPLMYMLRSGACTVENIEYAMSRGANINHTADDGETVFMTACEYSDEDTVKFLVENCDNINAKNKDGETGLFYVLRAGNRILAKYLIEAGADYNIVNNKGVSPVGIVIKEGYEDVFAVMTDIKVIDTSNEDDTSLTAREKKRAWEDDYSDFYDDDDEDDDNDDYYDDDYEDDEDDDEDNEDEDDDYEVVHTFDMSTRDYDAIEKRYIQSVGPKHAKEMLELLKQADSLYTEDGNLYKKDEDKCNELFGQIQAIGLKYSNSYNADDEHEDDDDYEVSTNQH